MLNSILILTFLVALYVLAVYFRIKYPSKYGNDF